MSLFYFPDPAGPCSEELAILLEDYYTAVAWLEYTGRLAMEIDQRNAGSSASNDLSATLNGIEFQRAKAFIAPGVRNITNTAVEAFLWYLSNMVSRVLLSRPEMLKSSEQVRIDEILDFGSREELVKFLVDRRVSRLAFNGILDIEKYIEKTLGLPLFGENDLKNRARFLIEVRNANAHNRGRASHIFLKRTNGIRPKDCSEGDVIPLGEDYHVLFEALIKIAIEFDAKCSEKFRFSRKPLMEHITDPKLHKEMRESYAMYHALRDVGILGTKSVSA